MYLCVMDRENDMRTLRLLQQQYILSTKGPWEKSVDGDYSYP